MSDPRQGLPSASAFEILAECYGQQQLVKRLPQEVLEQHQESPDPVRDSGTRIHAARETGNTLELDAQEDALYKSGLNYEKRILEKWKDVFSLTEVKEGPVELRLWVHDSELNPLCSGQLDVHYLSGKRAVIIDWKTAWCSNLIGAKGNWQLRLQAVLLKIEHPELEEVRVAFAKPMYEDSELDYADYNEMDLKYSLDSILYVLWWSTQADAPRRAGKHCLHCPAKSHCVEAIAFSFLPAAMAIGVTKGQKPEVAALEVGDDDLYRVYETRNTIKSIMDACVIRLKAKSEEQLGAMGLRLGKGRESLQWDVESAFKFLVTEKAWPESEVFKTMEFGIGKLGALATKQLGVDEKYANKEIKSLLEKFYTVTEGEKILRKAR